MSDTGFSINGIGTLLYEENQSRFESSLTVLQNNISLLSQLSDYFRNGTLTSATSFHYFNSFIQFNTSLTVESLIFSKALLKNILVRSFLSSIDNLTANLSISGSLDQLDIKVTSTLDSKFDFIYNR